MNNIIKWIENETGLRYGIQFHFEREEEREFYFRSSVNGWIEKLTQANDRQELQ